MFERRLKTFLAILLAIMCVLLLRAAHLQIVTKAQWVKEAEDFNKRPVYLETTRGRILDHNGLEIAIDEPCMDACVDYRAISRNPKWISALAADRLVKRLGKQYTGADKAQKQDLLKNEIVAVNEDIDSMWEMLAKVSGQTREQIDEICHTIDLKVAMRTRYVQYVRYKQADKADDQGPRPWYRRWLIEGGNGGPKVDDFEQQSNEEVDVHPIVPNISNDVMMQLAKARERSPGLVLKPGTNRRYPFHRAGAHLIGQLSPVTKLDLLDDPNLDVDEYRKYDATDLIGRGGLEGLAEPTLRGARGKVFRTSGKDDEEVSAPVRGQDIKTTIDIHLQSEIQQMFARMQIPSNKPDDARTVEVPMHGAAVVIDVKTAEVRALVSYPDYDPNDLAAHYEQLASKENDLDAPLMNRATQSQLEPGSTIKPAVGLGAITQGVITPTTGIECTGFLVLDGHKYPSGRCWVATRYLARLGVDGVKHHQIPVPHHGRFGNPDGFLCYPDALERSCNVFFETCAHKLGLEGLSYWLDRMGLGHETGIGISESCGRLPRDLARGGYMEPSVVWFSGIGQSGVLATPIQMANVSATIARDGIWMRPKLVETSGATLSPTKTRDGREIPDRVDLGLSKEGLAAAREGMTAVVNSDAGTGQLAHMDDLLVAGKTGTAQAARILVPVLNADGTPKLDVHGKPLREALDPATIDHPTETPWYRGWGADGTQLNHAWFIGFAPAKNPQVAFAVMIQYGGAGGYAGKIATQILERCLEHGYVKPNQ